MTRADSPARVMLRRLRQRYPVVSLPAVNALYRSRVGARADGLAAAGPLQTASFSSAALASCTRLPSSKCPEVSGSVAGALAMGLPTPGSTPLGYSKRVDTVGEVGQGRGE